MLKKTVKVQNKLGLHARATMKLNSLAGRFGCQITLEYEGKSADAKDILQVMSLGASLGKELVVITDGDDEQAAMNKIEQLFNDKFDEE